MTFDTLRLVRNILLRCFAVGLLIALVLAGITLSCWDTWMAMGTRWFHTDPTTLTLVVLNMFGNIRLILLFALLTPALAIHWTLKREFKTSA